MKYLTVFYDTRCAMCREIKSWLEGEYKYFPLHFTSLYDEAVLDRYPDLKKMDLAKEMIAIDENGNWYKGEKAWIMCLYATVDYRKLSLKMSHPMLLPLAKKVCAYVSQNRYALGRLIFIGKKQNIQRELEEWKPKKCKKGTCTV